MLYQPSQCLAHRSAAHAQAFARMLMVKLLARHDLIGQDKVPDLIIDAAGVVFGSARFEFLERVGHCCLNLHEKIYAKNYEREPIRSKPGRQSGAFILEKINRNDKAYAHSHGPIAQDFTFRRHQAQA